MRGRRPSAEPRGRRPTLIIAALALLTLPALPPPAEAQCRSKACEIRVAAKACDRGDVKACIRRAALHHRTDYARLLRVAWCESRLDPNAVNGQYVGAFQFGPALWSELRYRHQPRTSAKWSSLAAALAFRLGLSHHWTCR